MTRTTRSNSFTTANPNTAAISDVPRLFGKAASSTDRPPFQPKKNGAGRGNWGKEGDEIDELEKDYDFHFNSQLQRRRSNSNDGSGPNRRPSWSAR
ncbi:uncharacterized protein V1518DRAFT_421254, partial [Limtongia smithiae]|uniref:uncharacterized protein n=1 Tax=Limtongia smithiae TaxID=1125753 RepID=UPI0034CE08CA